MSNKDIKKIGKWQIIREIGRGGSGIIYEVVDTEDPNERHAALKLLNREFLLDQFRAKARKRDRTKEEVENRALKFYQEQIDLFKSEYQKIISIPHPNIARAYEFGYHEDAFYFCSELIKGKTLAQTLRGKKPIEMVPYFIQVLEGLDFIHRCGLLHLDIKSENILIQMIDGKPTVKIIDFGISIPPSEYKGDFCGSPSHIAPEVAFGWKDRVDVRADLFSVGVLFYFCLTWGRHPFLRSSAKGKIKRVREIIEKERPPRPPSRSHSKGIPEFLDTITLRLLAKEPENRFYGNARAVLNALLTHSPDSFAGTGVNYLIPPRGKHIGRDKELKEITERLEGRACPERGRRGKGTSKSPSPLGGEGRGEGDISAVYAVIGKEGMGKSHFLEYIKNQAEVKPEKWCTKSLSLPASNEEAAKWLSRLQLTLSEGKRGVVVLLDNLENLKICSDDAKGIIKDTFINLRNSVLDRKNNPGLFEETPPIILLYTSSTPSPQVGEGRGEGESSFVHKIHLQPFGTKELEQYLKAAPALRNIEPKRGWIKRLYEITGGVPSSVEWVLSEIDREGKLFKFDPEGNIYLTDELPAPKTLPPLTKDSLLDKYNKLDITERESVKLMAVWTWKGLAKPTTYEDISNFLPTLILQNIENLVMNGFIHPTTRIANHKPQSYEFNNSYLPTLIYNQIPLEDREIMHDAIASYLKTNKDAIMLHKGYGSNKGEAARSLVLLGRGQLYQKGRAKLADQLFSHALNIILANVGDLKVSAYVVSLLLSAKFYSGDYQELEGIYNSAAQKTDDDSFFTKYWKLRHSTTMVEALIRMKKFDDAKSMIRNTKQVCQDSNMEIMGVVFRNYEARCFFEESFHKPQEANNLLMKAQEIYKNSLQREATFSKNMKLRFLNNDQGVVLRSLGKYNEAIVQLTEKLWRLNEAKMIFGIMETLLTLADTCRLSKDYDSAENFGLKALELAKDAKNGRWLTYSNQALINIYHDADRFRDALDTANKCISIVSTLPDKNERKNLFHRLWGKMGHCQKELGEYNKAVMYFEAVTKRTPEDVYNMSAHVGLGEVYFYKNDYEKALGHLNSAEKLLGTFPEETHASRISELRTLISQKNLTP